MVDSAADISIVPRRLIPNAKLIPLKNSFEVSGYDQARFTKVTHRVELSIFFRPGVLKASFYVVDTPMPIIGTDLLQEKVLELSLITGRNLLRIRKEVLHTKNSPSAARTEYYRRKNTDPEVYRNQNRNNLTSTAWMRVSKATVVQPGGMAIVRAEIEATRPIGHEFTLLSLYTADSVGEYSVLVPNLTFNERLETYDIPVENRTSHPYIFERYSVLGEIITHSEEREDEDVLIYNISDVLNEIERRERPKSTQSPPSASSSTTVSNVNQIPVRQTLSSTKIPSQTSTKNNASTADSHLVNTGNAAGNREPRGVPFSSLINRDKVDNATLAKARDEGITIDVEVDCKLADVDLEIVEDVDVEAERAKSKSCPFWPDKDHFFGQFNFKDLPESEVKRIKSLLWDFKHCFYNEQYPQQFAAGLKMRPVKIDRLPDSQPKREKLRRVSDKKLAYLKSHINKLLSENVIKELQDTPKVMQALVTLLSNNVTLQVKMQWWKKVV